MDLSDTIVPKSDQLNAEDLLSGPRTFTIADVRKTGSDDQPVDIYLAEFPGRPFRPSKTVRRVLVSAWGKDGSAYVGRRMTLYRDPTVKWAGQEIGGIRVSHLSHIDRPLKIALTVTKGKRDQHTVQPLPDAPAADSITPQQLKQLGDGLTALGITDRAAMLATVAQVIDREIQSSKELTGKEAAAVLDWIAHEQQADDTEPQLPGAEGER